MYASTMPITETDNTAANESVRIDFLNMVYTLSIINLSTTINTLQSAIKIQILSLL